MAAAVATAPPTADEASPSSIDDLRSALRESLQQRGVLGRVRAQLRSEIFHTIDAGADAPPPRADPAAATLVVEELVREYLAFAGYGHALSVFEAESRSAERGASITRAQIQHELGVRQDGLPVTDVILPPWAADAHSFVSLHRPALDDGEAQEVVLRAAHKGFEAIRRRHNSKMISCRHFHER